MSALMHRLHAARLLKCHWLLLWNIEHGLPAASVLQHGQRYDSKPILVVENSAHLAYQVRCAKFGSLHATQP